MTAEMILFIAVACLLSGLLIGRFIRSGSVACPGPEMAGLDLEARVRLRLDRGQKIEAVKEIRQATGFDLKRSKEIVDGLINGRAFGELMVTQPGASLVSLKQKSPEVAREIEERVAAGKLIEALKLYREATGASLKEAKDEMDKIARM
jgi:ribosomal protein L7/L12